MDLQISQSFAYERKGDSAVILRCFSHESRAEVPEQIDGLPVKEIAPYAFSAMKTTGTLESVLARASVMISDSAHEGSGADISLENCAPALCGDRLEEISLPSTLEHVGRYCFYNCHHLRRLEFPGALHDWGSGAFSGCHQVRELCVYVEPEGDSALKQVLDELPEKLTVEFCQMETASLPLCREETMSPLSFQMGVENPALVRIDPNERLSEENALLAGRSVDKKQVYARLVFPDFYEEGVENTPARILETHVHGSGILFRNCFQGKKFDFARYDRSFPHALAQEDEALLTELVLDRLRWPYRLETQTQKMYETYVETHLLQFGKYFLSEKATSDWPEADESGEGLQWFLERFFDPKNLADGESCISQNSGAVLDELSGHAARLGDAEAISRLMEFRRSHWEATPRRKRLRL